MNKIRNSKGNVTNNCDEILKEQFAYYHKLYQANPNTNFTLKNRTGRMISQEHEHLIDAVITKDELTLAVHSFATEKMPGPDGLTTELYQVVWTEIVDYYFDAISYSLERGYLHISARRGILMLTPKKDRDLLLIKNWRPLTMLSIDYKVLAKALDN